MRVSRHGDESFWARSALLKVQFALNLLLGEVAVQPCECSGEKGEEEEGWGRGRVGEMGGWVGEGGGGLCASHSWRGPVTLECLR